MIATFFRVVGADDPPKLLRTLIEDSADVIGLAFSADPKKFIVLPRSPFAYWVSDKVRESFMSLPQLEDEGRVAKIGMSTSDDFRFVRCWWAASVNGTGRGYRWKPFAKGGAHSRFYADVHLVVNWLREGSEIKAWVVSNPTDPRTVHWSRRIANSDYFDRPGLTWPLRTTSGLALRAMPHGCNFGHKGPVICVEDSDESKLLELLSLTNSKAFQSLVELQLAAVDAAARSYEVGVIQRTPVPPQFGHDSSDLSILATRAWSMKRRLDSVVPCSHAFLMPAILQQDDTTVASRAEAWSSSALELNYRLSQIQSEIDNICFELYGISEEDRRSITEGFGSSSGTDEETDTEDIDDDSDDDTEDESAADVPALTAELVAWAVGVAVGRFDVRLATGEREAPPEPDPFDPLPVCSPGMLTGDDGLPVTEPPAGYPINWPTDGVLVDDPGHPRDLVAAVRSVFDVVFDAESDAYWAEAASILDPKGHDLRTWLAKSFFEHHIKKHSKSRRKAPILWQLGVPSGKYSIWLYAHRVTGDRLFSVLNEILRPKLDQEESLLGRLKADAGASPTSGQRKEIEAQEDFVAELKTMIEEVARVAPLWAPDLDDGVVICLAPLWRLFGQHKPWQKECKKIWDKLVAGDYDWAHLAMHLWPERVVPKCRDDRSLAIAHGLEDVFWEQDDKEKWKKRKAPGPDTNAKSWDDLIHRLVNERASRQVKDALSKLITAGQAAGNTGTRKRGRARSK